MQKPLWMLPVAAVIWSEVICNQELCSGMYKEGSSKGKCARTLEVCLAKQGCIHSSLLSPSPAFLGV